MRLIVRVVFGVICVTWCSAQSGGAQSFVYLAQNSDHGVESSNQLKNYIPFPQGAIKYDYNNLANLQAVPTEVIYGTSKEIPPLQPVKTYGPPSGTTKLLSPVPQAIQNQQFRPLPPKEQQLLADGATAFPVQLSFSINHGDYTFKPKPQIFYSSPQLPLPTHHIPQTKHIPQKSFNPSPEIKPLKQTNYQPISYPLPQIQYFGQPKQHQLTQHQPTQHLARPLPLPEPKHLTPSHLKVYPANVYPVNKPQGLHINKPQGHPPVKQYNPVSQSEKFRQQIYAKPQEKPIDPPKHVQEHRRPPPPPPPQTSPKKEEKEEEEEEEDEEEESNKKEESEDEEEDESDDSDEDEERDDRSRERDDRSREHDDDDDEEKEEEEEHEDAEKDASNLPPSHDHGEYDFDNRDYSPTFSAAKYIFNYDDDDRPKPSHKKHHKEDHKEKSRPYHSHYNKPDYHYKDHVKHTSPKPKPVEKPREEQPKNNYFYFYGPNEPVPKQSQSVPVMKNLHKEKWYLTTKKI